MTLKCIAPATPDLPLRLWADQVSAEISVLDYDGKRLWLRWLEPGRCHYGEQRWLLAAARHNGSCILSGLAIRRGQLVFRPAGRPVPSNADRMILPEQVERALTRHIAIAAYTSCSS